MANQFGDLPQIPGFVDENHWGPSPHRYIHGSMQYYGRPVPDEGIMYNDSFDSGMGSMQPMQRFLVDQSHYQPGMLHAKYDYTGPHPSQVSVHYEPMYPSIEGFRDASPDCTSISGTSSHATQNESRSPHPYHAVPYGSPKDFSQSSHPYPTVDHFNETPYLTEVPISGGSVSLRELEYEHYEPEATIEELECVEIKADAVYDHDSNIKINMAAKNYADSGIGNSVRDAESVQPIEPSEEPSSDSDYTPTRTSKRRRSSTSNNTAARNGQRRRGHGRNNSSAGLANGSSSRVTKKTRGAFNPTKANSDSNILTSGQRPFPCPLAPYNCKSTFSSKNEWKRHVSTQHIKLGFWRCDLCAPSVDPNDESTAYYNDFNRKDLFTQHLRRMHTAPTNSLSRNQREYVVTEDNLHEHQKRCYQFLRETPQLSACLFCERTFSGPNSWEERMEHVGRHLEKDRKNGVDLLNITTWNHDKTLENYLFEEGLIILEHGKWAIGDGKPRGHSDVNSDEESEQDE